MNTEEYRNILELSNYEVSNLGNIRNKKSKKVLKPKKENRNGINYWVLYINKKSYRVHRLVAAAFIPNTYNKPHVNHIDSNTLNNKVSNLEWVTIKENIQHAADKGRMGTYAKNKQHDTFKKIINYMQKKLCKRLHNINSSYYVFYRCYYCNRMFRAYARSNLLQYKGRCDNIRCEQLEKRLLRWKISI